MSLSRFSHAVAAAAILAATGGCNFIGGGDGGGGGGAAAVRSDISPQALQAAVQDDAARKFYEARQWQAAWSDEAGQRLEAALGNAMSHGLDPQLFTERLDQAGSPVEREVARTRAAIEYANALAHGRTDPAQLFDVYTLPRNQVDIPAGLAQAVQGGDAVQWIEGLAPQDQEYKALAQAFVQEVQGGQPQGQPQGQPAAKGEAPENAGIARAAVTQNEADAASNAQQPAHGPAPRAGGLSERAVQLAVNLERRRWLPRQEEPHRIDVNVAGSFLRYFRDNQQVDRRRVVVGEPGWETPQLGSPIYRLVANPDWTVPESIAEQENLKGLSQAALRRRNFAMEDGMFVQQPGPDNALGEVKFDMKNDHAIYLHDTPAKALFQQDERHRSHGCIRVQNAVEFAQVLAERSGKLPEFKDALSKEDTTFVDIDQNIPVRLLYHTAFLDEGGLTLSDDPYGWDAVVAEALGLAAPAASRENREEARQKRQERSASDGDYGP